MAMVKMKDIGFALLRFVVQPQHFNTKYTGTKYNSSNAQQAKVAGSGIWKIVVATTTAIPKTAMIRIIQKSETRLFDGFIGIDLQLSFAWTRPTEIEIQSSQIITQKLYEKMLLKAMFIKIHTSLIIEKGITKIVFMNFYKPYQQHDIYVNEGWSKMQYLHEKYSYWNIPKTFTKTPLRAKTNVL